MDLYTSTLVHLSYCICCNVYMLYLFMYHPDMIRAEFIMEDKGLGSLPSSIPTVGSCLLFNSHTNPYSNYQTLDNLMSTGRERVEDTTAKDGIHAAPSTLVK